MIRIIKIVIIRLNFNNQSVVLLDSEGIQFHKKNQPEKAIRRKTETDGCKFLVAEKCTVEVAFD